MLLRYRDDILILASSYEKFIAWFQKLKSKAGFFKLQCEEIVRFSKVEDKEVQFLQFRVQMNAKSRRLRLIPHSKNISMPLERTSAHAPAVHEWPTKHVETMCNLATDQSAREEAKLSVMAKLRQHLPRRCASGDDGCWHSLYSAEGEKLHCKGIVVNTLVASYMAVC